MNKSFFSNIAIAAIFICVPLFVKCSGGGSGGGSSDGSSNRQPGEPEMVFVQGGTFTMECDEDENTFQVTLSSFNIGKYPVTQGQWEAVMGTTVVQMCGPFVKFFGEEYPMYIPGEGDNFPMYCVSWDDVQEFIDKLNASTGKKYRLPTEAEWEYAARGGNKSKNYKYSGSNRVDDVAWYCDPACKKAGDDEALFSGPDRKTRPVGTKAPNELGIFDMSGNVEEWCSDWYDYYNCVAQTNPSGPSEGWIRVLRGGYWGSDPEYCDVSYRTNDLPDYRGNSIGFRLVLPH